MIEGSDHLYPSSLGHHLSPAGAGPLSCDRLMLPTIIGSDNSCPCSLHHFLSSAGAGLLRDSHDVQPMTMEFFQMYP
jgi:hypothetical protein